MKYKLLRKNTSFLSLLALLFCFGFTGMTYAQGTVDFTSVSTTIEETNPDLACNASRGYDISVLAIGVDPAATINIVASGGTATQGEDFEILAGTIEVSGTGTFLAQLLIFNDALIEGDETIELSFMFNGETKTSMITIQDEDVAPIVGNMTMELLNEGFDAAGLPSGWTETQSLDTGLNYWHFNGTGLAAGTAYITFDPNTTPVYDATGANPVDMDASSNALLVSPVLNAQGLSDVTVTFDWMAGGESNAQDMMPDDIFDYGAFQYTVDGGNSYVPVETFLGTDESFGATPDGGTFTMLIPELSNQTFQVAFRWISDQLVGNPFSFTVDNLVVTAEPLRVEVADTGSDTEIVRSGNDIYFISDENTDIMARIESPSEDSGCVEVSVISAGSATTVSNTSAGFDRGSKVIQITSDDVNAPAISYDLTLYFTPDEVSGFTDASTLQLVRVDGMDIDATTSDNFTLAGALLEDNTANGFLTYKGTFTGYNGVFALAQNATQGVADFNTSNIAIFPNTIKSGELLNVSSNNSLVIHTISIVDVRGKLVKAVNFNDAISAQLNTAGLNTGVYFVMVNNNKALSKKLIVE